MNKKKIKVKDSDSTDSKKNALHYMKTLVNVARESFLILDPTLKVLSANPTFYKSFKVKATQTENKLLYKLGNGQWNIPEFKKLLEQILPKEKVVRNYEVTHVFEKIGKKTMLLNARQVDTVQLIILAIEDITTTKNLQAEKEKLAKNNAKDEALIGSLGEGLIAVDNDKKIMVINKIASEMLGWKTKDLIGEVITDLPLEDEAGCSIPIDKRPTSIALKTGEVTKVAYFFVRKDKTKFPIAITATPIKLKGETIGLIEIIRDITKEKEIDRAKSEFISLASHQLKTPLTAIKLLTERLLNDKIGPLNEKQKEYFNDISFSNERMISLVDTLLDVSRIELGAFTIQVSKQDIRTALENNIKELQPIIDKKQLTLKTIFPKNNTIIMLDELLFHIIINNLLTNAINYTAKGGNIQVEGKIVDKGQALEGKLLKENSFVVIVSDTGYGIPKVEQNRVFTKFFRANNAREKQVNGTGLGLYIVKSILEHSGGLIWFTSEENVGSVFYIAIPMTGMKPKLGTKRLL